jgi:hypothetical protein
VCSAHGWTQNLNEFNSDLRHHRTHYAKKLAEVIALRSHTHPDDSRTIRVKSDGERWPLLTPSHRRLAIPHDFDGHPVLVR